MPVWYRDDPDDDVEIFRGTVCEMAQALDAAKQEIEQYRKALDHEHEARIEAAVEGSRYKAALHAERQNVRLLHDATLILRRAILTGDPTGSQDAYREATRLIDRVSDATRQIQARSKSEKEPTE